MTRPVCPDRGGYVRIVIARPNNQVECKTPNGIASGVVCGDGGGGGRHRVCHTSTGTDTAACSVVSNERATSMSESAHEAIFYVVQWQRHFYA